MDINGWYKPSKYKCFIIVLLSTMVPMINVTCYYPKFMGIIYCHLWWVTNDQWVWTCLLPNIKIEAYVSDHNLMVYHYPTDTLSEWWGVGLGEFWGNRLQVGELWWHADSDIISYDMMAQIWLRIMYSDMPPEFSDGLCVQDGLQQCHVEFQEMAFPSGSKFITGKSTWVFGRYR